MNVRGAAWNATGGIDCEIEHPEFGWVPFTAREDDPEGAELFEMIAALNPPPMTEEECLAARRALMIASRQSIATAMGRTLWAQCKAIAADPQTDWAVAVMIDEAQTWSRTAAPMVALIALLGMTDAEADALFQPTGS